MTEARGSGSGIGLRVAVAVLISACGVAPDASDSGVRIDTIGAVVRVRTEGAVQVWRAEPLTRIGSAVAAADPRPDEFGMVNGLVADAEGNVYVADRQAAEVRVFDAAGRFVRAFGRSGSGPGEFRVLQSLGWLGDTLAAQDGGNARISIFTRSGEPVATWRWYPITGSSSVIGFRPLGPAELATLAIRADDPPDARSFLIIGRRGPRDTLTLIVPSVPGASTIRCPLPGGGITFFGVPFAPHNIVTPAPRGEVARAWSAEYRIVFTVPAGDTLRVIERAHSPVPITDAQWDSATAGYRAFRREQPRVSCEPSEPPRAPHKPALRNVFFDHDGRLFVETYTADGFALDFFDERGVAVGRVAIPARDPNVAPYVRGDRFYLVEQDSLGIAYVQSYALRRTD